LYSRPSKRVLREELSKSTGVLEVASLAGDRTPPARARRFLLAGLYPGSFENIAKFKFDHAPACDRI
jgi:hypothetical protein